MEIFLSLSISRVPILNCCCGSAAALDFFTAGWSWAPLKCRALTMMHAAKRKPVDVYLKGHPAKTDQLSQNSSEPLHNCMQNTVTRGCELLYEASNNQLQVLVTRLMQQLVQLQKMVFGSKQDHIIPAEIPPTQLSPGVQIPALRGCSMQCNKSGKSVKLFCLITGKAGPGGSIRDIEKLYRPPANGWR